MASDATKGSKKVKISGKEVMLKNKSHFKKSMGDEAGCATKKGVMTSKNTGKVYFTSWSMDVKVEGQNVVRAMDLTTHNHGSFPSNTAPWPYADEMAFGTGGACEGVDSKFKLVPYETGGEKTCAPDTGHHLIPGRCMQLGTRSDGYPDGCSHAKAPVVCTNNKNQHGGTHRDCHKVFDPIEHAEAQKNPKGKMKYKTARDAAAKSASGINNDKELTEKQLECVKLQLDNYYKNCLKKADGSIDENADLKASETWRGLVKPSQSSVGGVSG